MNAAKKPEQCLDAESDQKAYWNRGLIAHGLWPIASTYRSTRSMTKLIYNSVIRGITRRFFYPNLFESISSPNAWKVGKHEWEAHGKYSGLNPTKYLQDTVRINTALAAPAYLGAHAGSVVNTNELKAQFPSEACLVCKYDSKSKQNYLFEVRYCLSVNHPGLTTGGVVPYAKCDICNSCNKNNTEIPRMQ
jgi:ribonuclease I